MSPTHLILIPLLGATIGWLTNWLAIRMLFRPKQPIRFFGLRLQGLIPRRQSELAERIGMAVEQELFNHADLRQAAREPAFILDCERAIHKHVSIFTEEKIGRMPGAVREAMGRSGVSQRFERTLADEICRRLPMILEDAGDALESNTDIRSIITEKVLRFEVEKIEEIVLLVARKELTMIELAGAMLGLMIGLVQVAVLLVL